MGKNQCLLLHSIMISGRKETMPFNCLAKFTWVRNWEKLNGSIYKAKNMSLLILPRDNFVSKYCSFLKVYIMQEETEFPEKSHWNNSFFALLPLTFKKHVQVFPLSNCYSFLLNIFPTQFVIWIDIMPSDHLVQVHLAFVRMCELHLLCLGQMFYRFHIKCKDVYSEDT